MLLLQSPTLPVRTPCHVWERSLYLNYGEAKLLPPCRTLLCIVFSINKHHICKSKIYAKLEITFITVVVKWDLEKKKQISIWKTDFSVFSPTRRASQWMKASVYLHNVAASIYHELKMMVLDWKKKKKDSSVMWHLGESVWTRGELPQLHIKVFIICVLFLCLQVMISLRASWE